MNLTHDLIGCPDDHDLAELLDLQPAAIESLLRDVLGMDEAVAATATLRDQVPRGTAAGLVRSAKVDPSLPEIVLLHGITDCHLANVSGRRNRVCLDYLELIKGNYTSHLTLQPDGRSDQPDVRIETDGPVAKKYGKALQAWGQSGFRTHVYCYDWRKSVFVGGDGLDAFLKGLETIQAGRKVILVCHSMGGLVAASYAARHADWADIVEHCIFVGSPLGGSYSVAVAILDWLSDFNALPYATSTYGRVHKGFYDGFQIARRAIDAILQAADASHKRLWLAGHSLGAALAVITAAEYQGRYSLAGLYTYGQPTVGGGTLRAFYEQHYPGRFFRFVNHQDIVPRVPPPPVYRHCGQLIWFNARGEHVERSAAALAAPGATSGEPGPTQLSEEDFARLQAQLRAMCQPSAAGAFRMPPSDAQIESQAMFGVSISDHSIRDGYIPAITKQF